MRLTRDMTIAGLPGLVARDVMRHVAHRDFILDQYLTPEARGTYNQLVAEGYLERFTDRLGDAYGVTIKGSALALASANRPVKRTTADRALAALIERAAGINDHKDLLTWVDKIAVFGSYLDPSVERLGDVDCVCWLTRRIDDGEKYVAASTARAHQSGRHLAYIETLFFGETEVRRLLKGRSPVLSLHDPDDRVLSGVELPVVYER